MTNPEILFVIQKMQDQMIIDSAMQCDENVKRIMSHDSMRRLTEMSVSLSEKEIFNAKPDVDYPVILTETFRQKMRTNLMFIDPQKAKKPLKVGEWLYFWLPFHYLNLEKNNEQASLLIGRALREASNYYDKQELQQFIDRLWKHRWIFDAFKCAQWRLMVLAENEKELGSIISEGKEAKRAFDELESRLTYIKDNVQTLDEWIDELYILSPLVKYNLIIHREMKSDKDDVKQRERFVDEISADIYAIFNATMVFGIFLGNEKVWTSLYLPKDKVSPEQVRTLKREMSYKYRARVIYPKFWFDDAISYLTNEHIEIPTRLYSFSQQHFLSCFISYDPESAYRTFSAMHSPEDSKAG